MALKRHRRCTRGGRTFEYDPSKKDKTDFLKQCLAFKPKIPYNFPVGIRLIFGVKRPLAHYTKRGLRKDASFYAFKKPDLDNYIKLVLDALNGVFYKDDSLICSIHAKKIYTTKPFTEIRLFKLFV